MAGVTNFQIEVPRKTAAGQQQIVAMRAVLSMETDAAVSFQITDPAGTARSVGPISPGSAPSELIYTTAPAGSAGVDVVGVVPPAGGLAASDPRRRLYQFYFDLQSDYTNNLPSPCSTTMAANETWTVNVTAGPEVSGVCLISFDRNIPGSECLGDQRIVPITEDVANVAGFPDLACPEVRPGLDLVMVLDHSGSMSSPVSGAGTQAKIEALRDAVVDLVAVWNAMRASEGAAAPTDNIGVVLFDHDAAWWAQTPGGLGSFPALEANIRNNVNTIVPTGATSIGDGLILADGALTAAGRRRVILLMSDGMQNSDKLVMVEGGAVKTYAPATPAVKTALPNQAGYQIYSVTVGAAGVIDPVINQNVANATKGFYVNSEDNAGVLSPFFVELLQNFLHFNSWETYRLISATVSAQTPFTTSIPITSTTQYLTINLRCPSPRVRLALRVQPPGDPQETVATGTGNINLRFNLPTSPTYSYLPDWQITVELASDIDLTHGATAFTVPIELCMVGEDASLDSTFTIAERDYVPGDSIQLEARLEEFGRPLTNLGSQPGATLVARVVRPGVSIGDLLSESSASTQPPTNPDVYSAAQAKLENELAKNPGALQRDSSDTVTLVDSGDGIYRGTYQVQTPGHYNFLFGLEGKTQRSGRFSRMQIQSVYVRPAPDPEVTQVATTVQPGDGRTNRLVLTVTPRTRFGHKLGPGWSNYFWFKPALGQAIKGIDNQNGSYTVNIPFSGPLPPPVSMHFLNIAQLLPDSINYTEDTLPVPLNLGNTLIPNVGWPGILKRIPWWLALLLFLLFLLYWLRKLFK